MLIRATYLDRIVVSGKHIYRIVKAVWPKTRSHSAGSTDVYRIRDDGREWCKHLAFSCYTGYMVHEASLDDDTWDEPAFNLKEFRLNKSDGITDEELAKILKVHPEFKWTLQKAGYVSRASVMNLLVDWLRNPKVELLAGLKMYNLIGNKTYERMTLWNKKRVLKFIRENEKAKYWPLNKIMFVLNGRGDENDYKEWNEVRDDNGKLVEYKWFCKYRNKLKNDKYGWIVHPLLNLYRDYLEMAKYVGHDIKDDYWKYPADIKKAHDKVMAEYNNVKEAERIANKKKLAKEERDKTKNYRKVVAEMVGAVATRSGLKAYIPMDYREIQRQAHELHQCLVSGGYYGLMASRKLMLVFIADAEGKPVATAEIMPNLKIGQFYADQHGQDIETMRPKDDAKAVLDEWMSKYSKMAGKVMKKKV